MPSPTSSTAPISSSTLPNSLLVDEMDLKFHQMHHDHANNIGSKSIDLHHRIGSGSTPSSYSGYYNNYNYAIDSRNGYSPDRIQGVVMDKEQLKQQQQQYQRRHHPNHGGNNNNSSHDQDRILSSGNHTATTTATTINSNNHNNVIPTTIIGGNSSSSSSSSLSLMEGYKACPCCRRYIQSGEFCTTTTTTTPSFSSSSLNVSRLQNNNSSTDTKKAGKKSNTTTATNITNTTMTVRSSGDSVISRCASMAEYSVDSDESMNIITSSSSSSSRRNIHNNDDNSTVLAGLSLDDDGNNDEDGTGEEHYYTQEEKQQQHHHHQQQDEQEDGISNIQGVTFPGVHRLVHVIQEEENVNPLPCGGGLAAYDHYDDCFFPTSNNGLSSLISKEQNKDKKNMKMQNNSNNSNGNTSPTYSSLMTSSSLEYTVKETIVQGWLHKKGTGNDFLGMRWWKPRWVTLALAQIPGQPVETPVLIAHRAPGVTFPANVTVLTDSTVVMAIERTKSSNTTTLSNTATNNDLGGENPLDRLSTGNNHRQQQQQQQQQQQEVKEEWNTHCFQIVNTASCSGTTTTRIFTAPLKERNEWVFAINQAIMDYEKRLSKERMRMQRLRPRSPSPVRRIVMRGGVGVSVGSGMGLPPTSPRRVRSPSTGGNDSPGSSRSENGGCEGVKRESVTSSARRLSRQVVSP